MNVSRRSFLKLGAAALAATAVTKAFEPLPKPERDKLEWLLRDGGVIENRIFYIKAGKPIKLVGLKNITIRGCQFIWAGGGPAECLLYIDDCDDVLIEGCHFDTRNHAARLYKGTTT